jgi:NAD-dependent SIR2 family protein deacetylase
MQNIFAEFRGEILELFPSDEQYVFLVGAGISMGFPSSLPSAREIVKSLFKLFSPEEELEKLLSLPQLRYELIVEKIQKYFDKDLKFLDFFDIIDTPNFIHYFLAKIILKKP